MFVIIFLICDIIVYLENYANSLKMYIYFETFFLKIL
jgi:hypothetical protein